MKKILLLLLLFGTILQAQTPLYYYTPNGKFRSIYTGGQIDSAIGKSLSDNIATPADVMETINDSLKGLSETSIYLMSGFRTSDMSLYLYSSNDGKNWITKTKGTGSYTPKNITNVSVVRDPSIIYHNNKYWAVHTSNPFAADSGFALISSDDLITWNHVAFVKVNAVQTVNTSRVYAPDFFIDDDGSVSVYVAISQYNEVNFKLYELHPLNNQMTAWSEPTLVTGEFPTSAFDANMIKIGGIYYLWYSDVVSGSYVCYSTSTNKTSGFVRQKTGDWAGWGYQVEGSSLIKINGNTWRIYLDDYSSAGNHHYIYFSESSDNFNTWTFKQKIKIYDNDVQHVTVIKTNNFKVAKDAQFISVSKDSTLQNAAMRSEELKVDSAGISYVMGNLGVGTQEATEKLTVNGTIINYGDIINQRSENNAWSLNLMFRKSRGSLTSPTIISSGDELGGLQFRGHNGTSFENGASIQAVSAGSWTTSSNPGELRFSTTPVNQTWASLRVAIQTDGTVLIKNKFALQSPVPPTTSTSTGVAGQLAWDANYIYVCTATNTWKRVAISTW